MNLLLSLVQADGAHASLPASTIIVVVLFALFIGLVWWGNRPATMRRYRSDADRQEDAARATD